jgi:hypothetical protein
MFDQFALLSSSLCILYVIWRAVQLDQTLPWFDRQTGPDRQSAAKRGDAFPTNSRPQK